MSGKTTAGILTLRLCIGGYLIYLAYSLVIPLPTDTKMRVISIVFAVLFAVKRGAENNRRNGASGGSSDQKGLLRSDA